MFILSRAVQRDQDALVNTQAEGTDGDNARQSNGQAGHPAGSGTRISHTIHISASHAISAGIGLIAGLLIVSIAAAVIVVLRRRKIKRQRKRDREHVRSSVQLCQKDNEFPLSAFSTPPTASLIFKEETLPVEVETSTTSLCFPPPSAKRPELQISTAQSLLVPASPLQSVFLCSPQSSTLVDEQAERITRALACSPVVSALLNESFDQSASRVDSNQGSKSFDWDRCTFAEEEEKAMWLSNTEKDAQDGEIKRSKHHRSVSEPITVQATLGIGSLPSHPERVKEDTQRSIKSSHRHEHMIRVPQQVQEREILSEVVTNTSPVTYVSPSSRSFIVLSRPSSAKSDKTRVSILQREGSFDSTASLRRAGALSIRTGTPIKTMR